MVDCLLGFKLRGPSALLIPAIGVVIALSGSLIPFKTQAFGAKVPKESTSQISDPISRDLAFDPNLCAMSYQRLALGQAAQKVGNFVKHTVDTAGANLVLRFPDPTDPIIRGFVFRPVSDLPPAGRVRQFFRNLNSDIVGGSYRLLSSGRQLREPFVFAPLSTINNNYLQYNRALAKKLFGQDVIISPHFILLLGAGAVYFATDTAPPTTQILDDQLAKKQEWRDRKNQQLEELALLEMLESDVRFSDTHDDVKVSNLSYEQKIQEARKTHFFNNQKMALFKFLTSDLVLKNGSNPSELLDIVLNSKVLLGDISGTLLEDVETPGLTKEEFAIQSSGLLKEEFKHLALLREQSGEVLTDGIQWLIPKEGSFHLKPRDEQFFESVLTKIRRFYAINYLPAILDNSVSPGLTRSDNPVSNEFYLELRNEILSDDFIAKTLLPKFQEGKLTRGQTQYWMGWYLDKKYNLIAYDRLGFYLKNPQRPQEHVLLNDYEAYVRFKLKLPPKKRS